MSKKSYKEQYDVWLKNRFAPPPEPELTPSRPTMIEMVPMRDGVRLYTEIFLPNKVNCTPVILRRSPYPYSRPSRNDKAPISRYLEAGYAYVFQLTRGQGKSEGTFHMYKDDAEDGKDCIDWIATQEWCDCNIGMCGASYSGMTQVLAAQTKPEALKCIMPTAFPHFFSCFPYMNGVLNEGSFLQWHKVADTESMADLDAPYGDMSVLKHPVWGPALCKRPLISAADDVLSGDKLVSWRDVVASPINNEYWQSAHIDDEFLAGLDLPILITDGWFDMTIGPIDIFERMERFQSGREDRYLLVGPWDHGQTGAGFLHERDHGERTMPKNGAVDLIARSLAFYDRYLKGKTDKIIQPDQVRVYITGIDKWFDFPTFPAPGTEMRRLYLHSGGDARSFPGDGQLTWELPSDEPVDSYVYDPNLPTPSEAEPIHDRREIEIRSDVLTYTSASLEAPLTILGDIKLVLHAASDGLDTDWFALVTEVFPDGRSIAFHYAIPSLRARYHQGIDKEVMLTPNEPAIFQFSLGPAGHQIAAGNRLRLAIFSAAFPMCDVNTNTGNPVATDTILRVARQTVFHDTAKPSHIVIPVIN